MSPRAADDDFPITAVPLEKPRPLTADERALLDALVEPLGVAELSEQVSSAEVESVCSCGCPSVKLRTDGRDVPTDVTERPQDNDGDDYFLLTGWSVNEEGRDVEVSVHVISGRLDELEIWPGWDGGEVATELPSPESLRSDP